MAATDTTPLLGAIGNIQDNEEDDTLTELREPGSTASLPRRDSFNSAGQASSVHKNHFHESNLIRKEERPPTAGGLFYYLFSPETTLPPLSTTRTGQLFTVLVCFFVIYNVFTIPFRGAFQKSWQDHHNDVFLALDYIGDVLFLLDIYFNFRCAVMHDGIEVNDQHHIVNEYVSTWFYMDAIASLPLDLIIWNPVWKHVALRWAKFLRLPRVLERISELQHSTKYALTLELVKLVVGIVTISHWLGCAYVAISYADGFAEEDDPESWTPPESFEHATLGHQYYLAFAWGVKAVTDVGGESPKAQTNLQHAFIIVLGFVHVFLIAIVIGSVEGFMSHLNHNAEQLRRRIMHLNRFMQQRHLPLDLQTRIRKYYYHLWSRKGAFDSPDILRDLPTNLRALVHGFTRGQVLAKVTLFRDCDAGFLNDLADRLKPRIYAPGDYVVQVDEKGDEMFFLNRGEVDIFNARDEHIATLTEGSIFGEVAFFNDSKRMATVKARTWCDFAALERRDFERVCLKYPAEKTRLHEYAMARMASDALYKVLNEENPLFADMTKAVRVEILRAFDAYSFTQRKLLYSKGEEVDCWLFVGVGQVRTFALQDKQEPEAGSPGSDKPKRRPKVLQRKATSLNSSLGIGTEEQEQVDLDVVEKKFLGSPFPFGLETRQEYCDCLSPKCTIMALPLARLETILRKHGIYERTIATFERLTSRQKSARARFKGAIRSVVLQKKGLGFLFTNQNNQVGSQGVAFFDEDLGFELEPEAQAIREQIWLSRDDLHNLTPQVLGSVQAIVSRQLSVIAEVSRLKTVQLMADLEEEAERGGDAFAETEDPFDDGGE
eukprot:m.276454 g.276454  ORF g.276454 m.276454 type:complete len:831 (-) comp17698_c0_seq2:8158-10650(-)